MPLLSPLPTLCLSILLFLLFCLSLALCFWGMLPCSWLFIFLLFSCWSDWLTAKANWLYWYGLWGGAKHFEKKLTFAFYDISQRAMLPIHPWSCWVARPGHRVRNIHGRDHPGGQLKLAEMTQYGRSFPDHKHSSKTGEWNYQPGNWRMEWDFSHHVIQPPCFTENEREVQGKLRLLWKEAQLRKSKYHVFHHLKILTDFLRWYMFW